jgi:hypothetical protein
LPSPVAPSLVMSNVVPVSPLPPSSGAAAAAVFEDLFVAHAAHTATRTQSALIALRAEAIFDRCAGQGPLLAADIVRERQEARLLCTRNGRLAFAIFRQRRAFLTSAFYRFSTSSWNFVNHMSTSQLQTCHSTTLSMKRSWPVRKIIVGTIVLHGHYRQDITTRKKWSIHSGS